MPDEPSLFPDDVSGGAAVGRRTRDERSPGRTGSLGGTPSTAGYRAPGSNAIDPCAPLAARMRPRSLEEFVGQEDLVGPGRPLRELIESGRVPSLILWGPPGSGKTTLAGLLADRAHATFVLFSAVTEGIPRVRQVIAEALERRGATGRGTVLFVDEIHRFNRAQQDALLPHVERGTVTLIGATTENPSFEVVGPLLSRTRVLVLSPLSNDELEEICRRALADEDRGLGARGATISVEALKRIATEADGDARRALNALETAVELAGDREVDVSHVEAALQKRYARYDKSGEEHYNLISALHKAVRGSDPDGALYWLSRMLEAGEDPMYLARRLVRMATEDVGLADPAALSVCVAARDAYHFLGSPEGELALAQAATYLALAPKSNSVYEAFGAAGRAARETPAEPVPLHLRNAPTQLMRDLGYGRDYRYDHAYESGVAPQTYLPDAVSGRRFYRPGERGWEEMAGERMREVAKRRASPSKGPESDHEGA